MLSRQRCRKISYSTYECTRTYPNSPTHSTRPPLTKREENQRLHAPEKEGAHHDGLGVGGWVGRKSRAGHLLKVRPRQYGHRGGPCSLWTAEVLGTPGEKEKTKTIQKCGPMPLENMTGGVSLCN